MDMNPYQNLADKHFWKLAVAVQDALSIRGLWDPKFDIKPPDKVVTYGSCFAQHIGNALKARKYNWLNTECAPAGMQKPSESLFNYGIFSSRTGNIYTTSLLRQWTRWASGAGKIPEEVWRNGERFIDPFRPVVEPNGFRTLDELRRSQNHTVACFRRSIEEADFFVFTLGLTESWFHSKHGYEYPMCPGTIGGVFDPAQHTFVNQTFSQILEGMADSIQMMRKINPKIRFILTVSPVPLTATQSGKHVLTATMQSKSVLRAVAGQLADSRIRVDYFPSYEIISSPVFRGQFYESNLRSVTPAGVSFVMDSFFDCLASRYKSDPVRPGALQEVAPIGTAGLASGNSREDDLHCEELLLEAFANMRPTP